MPGLYHLAHHRQSLLPRNCKASKRQGLWGACLQVKLVEDTCIRYLLQLKLPAEQISQIMRLYDTLMLLDPRKQLLKKYAHTAWVEGV